MSSPFFENPIQFGWGFFVLYLFDFVKSYIKD